MLLWADQDQSPMEEENSLAWVGVDWSLILFVKEMIWLCKNKCFFCSEHFLCEIFWCANRNFRSFRGKILYWLLLKDADSKIQFCLSFLIFNWKKLLLILSPYKYILRYYFCNGKVLFVFQNHLKDFMLYPSVCSRTLLDLNRMS